MSHPFLKHFLFLTISLGLCAITQQIVPSNLSQTDFFIPSFYFFLISVLLQKGLRIQEGKSAKTSTFGILTLISFKFLLALSFIAYIAFARSKPYFTSMMIHFGISYIVFTIKDLLHLFHFAKENEKK